MAETSDLEKMRKGLAAALEALGPEPVPEPTPPATPANPPVVSHTSTPKKRTIMQTEGNPLCTDCDTGEQLLVADPNTPDALIRGINMRHKHGDLLNCTTCRPAVVQALTEGGYDVKTDEGPGGELRIVPKKK